VVDAPAATTCWPVDTSACPGFDALEVGVQARATYLAGETMRTLTGYRLGSCPTSVRPAWECSRGGSWMLPTNRGGHWFNVACPHGTTEINLAGEDVVVDEVTIGGATIDPEAYEVRQGHILARIDGDVWPLHQDMTVAADAPGSFTVTYTPGPQVDSFGAYAAGLLACEFSKVLTGGSCRLPPNVTSVTRTGVSMELQPDDPTVTGIREVDLYVRRWNPHHLVSASVAWSPDLDARPARPSLVARGPAGPRGPQGLPGAAGSGGSTAVLYTQEAPAASWVIPHSFGRVPDVAVYLTTGEQIDPDIIATETNVTVTFPTATAGSAVLT
jgi:hypothetical protein